jgi:chromosome partitioning protein
MRILTVASQKGGSGKTTLTAHLAVEAEHRKAGPVAVIDTDPQGSLASWWNTREAPTPLFAAVNIAQLDEHLTHLRRQGINLVLIDTPPQTMNIIKAANTAADFVLIPARPSPHDLRAVAVVVDMVEQAKKPFCFVVNGATPRTNIAREAVGALAEHGKVAPVIIHHRVDFAASMVDGRTVSELAPDSRSAQEITLLWDYVLAQLRKYAKGT